MSTSEKQTSRVHRLAEHLEQDIRCRGLGPGDRYLTAAEAGNLLGVSTATAYRAMKVLAERQLLVGQRKRGTFIGPRVDAPHRVVAGTIYLLMHGDKRSLRNIRFETLIDASRAALPGADIHVSFVPKHDALASVRRVVSKGRATGELSGVVTGSLTREVHQFLAEFDIPTLILGSTYFDHPGIRSLDIDQREAGRLLVQYLVEQGHQRMALLTHAKGYPGDNHFFDGVSEALTTAGLPHNALVVRLAPDFDSTVMLARELLDTADRPSAFIARTPGDADAIGRTAASLGLKIPSDVEVVFQHHCMARIEPSPYPHVRPRLSGDRIAELLGTLLGSVCEGKPLEENHAVVPVDLHVPEKVGLVETDEKCREVP